MRRLLVDNVRWERRSYYSWWQENEEDTTKMYLLSEHELTLWRTVLPHSPPSSQEMPHHVLQGKLNYSVLKKSPLFPALSHFNPVLTHKQRL
jgi:hypothetical protein